jgi:hypothetical protein
MDSQVLNIETVTIQEFIDKYHPTLTYPAIVYAVKNGKVSGNKEGRRWVITLDEKTLRYNPIRATKTGRL